MMLEVQRALMSGVTLDELTELYGIKVVHHPTYPLVLLKYDQLKSPETHPIVMECRGLILEKETWKVVSMAFRRFFNYMQHPSITDQFQWDDFVAMTKEDGSLISMYHYDGTWNIATSGSFGDGEVNGSGMTWNELFFETLEKCAPNFEFSSLNEEYTHVFELCTPYNKVVRMYPESVVRLIGITHLVPIIYSMYQDTAPLQISPYAVEVIGGVRNLPVAKLHTELKSKRDVENYIKELEKTDPTNEGLVLTDQRGLKLKVKNSRYLDLHKMCDNGNLFAAKRIVPFILQGDTSELLTYFPEAKDRVDELKQIIADAFDHLHETWLGAKDIEDQKEFALYVVKERKEPFSSILFQLRQDPSKTLSDVFFASTGIIMKKLFKSDVGIPKGMIGVE